ncbi:hypothetical protein FB561_1400 [Kribbella amoyensis]|uniref:Uncharacterized protein n=1 Tax=Kribbella amoyensis TaxID=996641 RepID=A0A561BN57_9ACTN|nr:hypothetical protein [Kribbella amoyensis]TWD80326.1 hypothetical protein FB561_1400 [Kribbella amoyensis]
MFAHLRRLAVLLAVLAFLPTSPAHAAPPELPDRIAAAWKKDPLYIDEGLRVAFPKAELDRIRAAAKTVDFPVYIALVPRTPEFREDQVDLVTLLYARIGKPALYTVWSVSDDYWAGSSKLTRPAGLKGRELVGVQLDDKQDNDLVKDRPAPGIARTVQQAATAYDGRPLPQIPASDLQPPRKRREGPSVTDQEDKAAFTGMGIGGGIGFLLTLILTLLHRRSTARRRDGIRPRSATAKATAKARAKAAAAAKARGEAPSTVSAVQDQADRWLTKAGRSVKSLEARKNKSSEQLDRRDDAVRRLDAARTLREAKADDLLTTAGALVLARQAHQAATATKVQPPCFFDPTHPSGTHQATWSDDTDVPACRNCARTVERGGTPRGLRVPGRSGLLGLDRSEVPYWTLDPEDSPLVASGFGALTDDLPERVERAFGGVR